MPALACLVDEAHGSISDTQPLLEKHLRRRACCSGSNRGGPSPKLDAIYIGSIIAAVLLLVLMCWMANRWCGKKKE
ncbi:hypothetical protein FVEN_g12747 [Fusarium venenatum]|uniref:Uncharacterized protein n=1 Tax=Fusarium venenatum TaxID=56646 RepID=A0A2L2T6X8_9HYPO|nr:uncharacterized protein FVRRES_13890 [Fusarium venenatum]KAG8358777.1 hypothetical protein FVEN_g12747 [Fusarium venenatum]CEI42104.1 unnamed protein product [Fusarium venenatum]